MTTKLKSQDLNSSRCFDFFLQFSPILVAIVLKSKAFRNQIQTQT